MQVFQISLEWAKLSLTYVWLGQESNMSWA